MSPIRITSNGPSTLLQIVDVHRDVIEQATGNLSDKSNSWLQATKYSLLSLCQVVILVLDDLGPDPEPDPDGAIRIEKESQRRSVLTICNRDEDNLSKTITFEGIRMHALPLARDDIPNIDNRVFTIRVSLSIAVNFIVDLKHREEAAFFSPREHLAVDDASGPST